MEREDDQGTKKKRKREQDKKIDFKRETRERNDEHDIDRQTDRRINSVSFVTQEKVKENMNHLRKMIFQISCRSRLTFWRGLMN